MQGDCGQEGQGEDEAGVKGERKNDCFLGLETVDRLNLNYPVNYD